ncbi:MAG: 2OG-Fe(II) oxygenase [Caulobacteraceae bacterium]
MALADLETGARAGDPRAQIALARRLDEQGRHDDAINWLSTAAGNGSAEALGLVGARLVSGVNAPYLPKDGARLLAEAAGKGDADAAAMLAVLAGGGFHLVQNWETALDYLQRAAEFGSASAQAQLRLLAGAEAEGTGADRWATQRRQVSVASWTRAPPARTLSRSPLIQAVEGLVPAEVCDWVVGQASGRLARAEVFDPRTGKTVMGATRTNRVANFGLQETSLLNLFIQARLAAATGVEIARMEAFAVLNYRVGEEASEHFDYLDPSVPAYASEIAGVGQRVMTALLYLNDDYEGGTTDFPALGLSHRGRRGDGLIFRSVEEAGAPDPRTLHAGRPPTAGEKWVLSQFIRNRRWVG